MTYQEITLPSDFVPPADAFVMGRGKRHVNHEGNQRLRDLVKSELPAYLAAPTKTAKSAIIHRVLMATREKSADGIGFVRYDNQKGTWHLVDNGTARITVSQNFRDALSKHYKSSKQYKKKRRQDRKAILLPGTDSKTTKKKANKTNAFETVSMLTATLEEVRRGVSSPFDLPCSVPSSVDTCVGNPASSLVGCRASFSVHRIMQQDREENLFDSLFSAFGTSQHVDPFEPTPVKEQKYQDTTFVEDTSHQSLLDLMRGWADSSSVAVS